MGLRPAKFHEKPGGHADWAEGGGGPPGPRGTPSSRCPGHDIMIMQSASKPTGGGGGGAGGRARPAGPAPPPRGRPKEITTRRAPGGRGGAPPADQGVRPT